MLEVNIDADLVRDGGAGLSPTEEKLVKMTNGCICCTLRDDLLEEVRRLAAEGRFENLLIESTGSPSRFRWPPRSRSATPRGKASRMSPGSIPW